MKFTVNYKRLETSGNFSKLQFETKKDLLQFIEDNQEVFRFVSKSINWETLTIVY